MSAQIALLSTGRWLIVCSACGALCFTPYVRTAISIPQTPEGVDIDKVTTIWCPECYYELTREQVECWQGSTFPLATPFPPW